MPCAWRPWAWSPRTIWLDKCCIKQSPPEMVLAGVASFGIFLADCDNMVAFISPTYFSRLWCVYELATFCRMHKGTRATWTAACSCCRLSGRASSTHSSQRSSLRRSSSQLPASGWSMSTAQCRETAPSCLTRYGASGARRRLSRPSCALSCQRSSPPPSCATADRRPAWRGVPSRWPLAANCPSVRTPSIFATALRITALYERHARLYSLHEIVRHANSRTDGDGQAASS
mmetsp:Transcript_22332/g.53511  ORF Transcript_22332/g.53511 Transcript_22332/m.53511 type:complete len:231 (+) Transcript_22332:724-1416(+)